MEDRTRLGRGLEEVSQFYLSDRPREISAKERKPEKAVLRRSIIRILYPSLPAIKSCLAANLALELAKDRHHVMVRDGFERQGVQDMLQKTANPDLNPGAATVRLYGLPDIIVYPPDAPPAVHAGENIADGHFAEKGSCVILNLPDSLESVARGEIFFDAIIMAGVDEASLLQCYAYIKVIWERDPSIRIHIVIDDPGTDVRGHEIFTRLSGFIKKCFSGDLNLLGYLMHDDLLEMSIEEHNPLVLRHENSVAKDSIMAIGRALLQTITQLNTAR